MERPRPHASESAEREAALRRGRERRFQSAVHGGEESERHPLWTTNPAFAALAENVRDYAIFLLDPAGVITFWGEGAHLMKWWTRDEAEGAHLRLLYPEGGSEDGTAEDHLREAEAEGGSVGEGSRVRRDASTFWAHITLTALRNPAGELIGFCKTTRDLTARRTLEAALAAANAAQTARDVALAIAQEAETARDRAREEAELAREQARGASDYMRNVLEPELAQERAKRFSDPTG